MIDVKVVNIEEALEPDSELQPPSYSSSAGPIPPTSSSSLQYPSPHAHALASASVSATPLTAYQMALAPPAAAQHQQSSVYSVPLRPNPNIHESGLQYDTTGILLTPAQREVLEGQQYQQQLLARCAKGDHEETTTYGEFGVIASRRIPIVGVLFLLFDREKKCARCGVRLIKDKDKKKRKAVIAPPASASTSPPPESSIAHDS